VAAAKNHDSFFKRILTYQKERFPFIAHGILISSFTFSAISYSRICRHAEGFIQLADFLIGVFATITLFFLVRIFDEFKDQEEDKKFRSYLPVPRGLISLKELKNLGLAIAILQILAIAIFQSQMIWLYLLVIAYLLLMGVEFFIPEWLKKNQLAYITSHMFIIPLIDLYSSGLDWLLEGSAAHWGLAWFFVVSYFNGLVLEFGRKLRTPEGEEEGVISYTGLYGTRRGTLYWIGLMFLTMILAMGATFYVNGSMIAYAIIILCFIICSLPGWLFLKKFTAKRAKFMEYSSALWTILMYLTLGAFNYLPSLTLS